MIDKQTHFLQIWIMPKVEDFPPSYAQKSFFEAFHRGGLILVGSATGRDGRVSINQDVDLYACKSDHAGEAKMKTSVNRRVWMQIVIGAIKINGEPLQAGDGAAIEAVPSLQIARTGGCEFLVFDLP